MYSETKLHSIYFWDNFINIFLSLRKENIQIMKESKTTHQQIRKIRHQEYFWYFNYIISFPYFTSISLSIRVYVLFSGSLVVFSSIFCYFQELKQAHQASLLRKEAVDTSDRCNYLFNPICCFSQTSNLEIQLCSLAFLNFILLFYSRCRYIQILFNIVHLSPHYKLNLSA